MIVTTNKGVNYDYNHGVVGDNDDNHADDGDHDDDDGDVDDEADGGDHVYMLPQVMATMMMMIIMVMLVTMVEVMMHWCLVIFQRTLLTFRPLR
jgi:hypothetical protein